MEGERLNVKEGNEKYGTGMWREVERKRERAKGRERME